MKVLFVYIDLEPQKNRKGELVCGPGGWYQEGIATIAANAAASAPASAATLPPPGTGVPAAISSRILIRPRVGSHSSRRFSRI